MKCVAEKRMARKGVSVILPAHESSPEPLRVDFTRERRRQLQLVELQ